VSSQHFPAAHNGLSGSDTDGALPPECDEALRSLWDYLDGNCAGGLAERLAEHLASCGPCFRLRQFQERFFAALAEMRQRSRAPAHLRDRVGKALATERRSRAVVAQE
jgi:mycothiol system anti-sigma-R factor